ncbi:MAG: T9SS type A sorting domain-containing protein, partial [Bacteroidia bacterium]|nr:T9SS type A sorting domain-containing protein [Bacteroidia bacterium]
NRSTPRTAYSMYFYPNPAREKLYVRVFPRPTTPPTVKILNLTGQTLQTTFDHETEIDVSNLPAGIYLIEIGGEKRGRFCIVR